MKIKAKWEKKDVKKLLLTTAVITAGILAIGGNASKAALQANATTHDSPASKTGAMWIEEIRKMETEGNTMGLREILKEDLSPEISNNIDVHMMRTTEYGAVAILSASGFGNPKKLSEVTEKTSTGNVTGVYMGIKGEWTAGVGKDTDVGKNTRYYDSYTLSDTSAKVGDMLGTADTPNPGCAKWHDGGARWLYNSGYASNIGFVCGGRSIFNYEGYYQQWVGEKQCGRGVVVVGEGL